MACVSVRLRGLLCRLRAQGTDPESLWLQEPEGNGRDLRGKGRLKKRRSAVMLKAQGRGTGPDGQEAVAQVRQWGWP